MSNDLEETYAACGHGLPDGVPWLDCWSCMAGIGLGPDLPRVEITRVRYSAAFVEQFRALSGNHRFPLEVVDV